MTDGNSRKHWLNVEIPWDHVLRAMPWLHANLTAGELSQFRTAVELSQFRFHERLNFDKDTLVFRNDPETIVTDPSARPETWRDRPPLL